MMSTLKIAYFYVAQFLPECGTERLSAIWRNSFLRRWLRKHRASKLKEKKRPSLRNKAHLMLKNWLKSSYASQVLKKKMLYLYGHHFL